MGTVNRSAVRILTSLAVLGALLAALAVQAASAEEGPTAAPRILGCSWAPARWAAEESAELADADDDGDEDEEEEDEPRIVGSLAAPSNVRRNDQRALAAVATIGREEAIKIALGVLPDAERRRLEDVELEVEQGYVIWEVEAILRGSQPSPDRIAEVVIDAGNGNVLFVECEAEDD